MLFVAVAQDIWKYRVKNVTIFIGYILGVLFLIFAPATTERHLLFLGAAVPLFVLFPIYCMKGLGAGDIKLYSVIGLSVGILRLSHIFTISILCGGIQAIACVLYHVLQKKSLNQIRKSRVHFTVSILAAVLIHFLYG